MSQLTPAPSGAKGRDFVLGDEVRVRILTSGAETEGRHDFLDCVQQAGAATPLHLHTRYEERLFLVAGSLTVWAGEQTVTLGPGDFYTIPTDTPTRHQGGARRLQGDPGHLARRLRRADRPHGDAGAPGHPGHRDRPRAVHDRDHRARRPGARPAWADPRGPGGGEIPRLNPGDGRIPGLEGRRLA
jgi:hypothetical protein